MLFDSVKAPAEMNALFDNLIRTGDLVIMKGQMGITTTALILMIWHIVRLSAIPAEIKNQGKLFLNDLAIVATDRGCENVRKVLFRDDIDEFTHAKAKEIDDCVAMDECLDILRKYGPL